MGKALRKAIDLRRERAAEKQPLTRSAPEPVARPQEDDPFAEDPLVEDPFAEKQANPRTLPQLLGRGPGKPRARQATVKAPAHTPKRSGKPACRKAGPAVKLRSGEEAIEEALKETTTVHFTQCPLHDIVDHLRDKHRINILIDRRALEDVGFGTDAPITIGPLNVPLRSALGLMLKELDLTWTIHEGVLMITTPEEAETILVTRVYGVADLVTFRDETGEVWEDYDNLIDTICAAIEPTTWDTVGGPGSIAGGTFGTSKALVVSQTRQVHLQVAELLEKLRSIAGKKSFDGQPPRKRRPPEKPRWWPSEPQWPKPSEGFF